MRVRVRMLTVFPCVHGVKTPNGRYAMRSPQHMYAAGQRDCSRSYTSAACVDLMPLRMCSVPLPCWR